MPNPVPDPALSNPNPPVPDSGSRATPPQPGAAGTSSTRRQPSYRPKGKIVWLDKPVRDRINQLLLDGLPYPAILTALGPDGQGLNVNNLWRYHKGTYRHWLREQHWLAETRVKEEAAAELCQGLEDSHLSQAAVQTTIVQIHEALRNVTSGSLKEMLAKDPRAYARIVNALSRLSKESLNLQKHRQACAKAVATELKHLDPNREFSDREHEIITDRMDDYFLRSRRRRTGGEAANEVQPSSPPPGGPSHP